MIKIIIPFKREHKLLELIIPKNNPYNQYDKERILKLEALCPNLLYYADNYLIGLSDEVIRNKNEINTLLNGLTKHHIKKLNK